MDKIRIYAVAQELGVPSKELLAYLEEDGLSFSSHLALIDAATAARLRARFGSSIGDLETVLSPSPSLIAAEKRILDFAPFQVEAPEKPATDDRWQDDDIFAASEEAVAKVEQKVAAATQAPVRQSLVTSALATASVAVAPTFVAFAMLVFGQPNPRPFLAVLLSIVLTAGSIVVGSAVWATQPESAGFSFGDLMLWSWVRREAAERTLIENSAILGFDRFGRFLGHSTASPEEQMRAVREIAAALDAKSSYTLGHSRRVEKHVRKVAEALGLSADDTAALATAASLHDIGNIQIPDELLRKTGELTIEERGAIEAHVLLGARMVLKAGSDEVVDGIRHHHERWDGAGYPDGMSGDDIPLYARIIGIAEAYDAMTSTRPYRQGFSREHAIEVLRGEAGLQFDGDLVEMFVATLPEGFAVFRKFPFLARVQRQMQELQLLFKRMGAIAVSATASTIAIALLLGGTVLAPGTNDVPDLADRQGRVTPIDRVLAERLSSEDDAYDGDAPLSEAVAPRGATAMSPESTGDDDPVDERFNGGLDGGDLAIDGGTGGGTDGPGGGTDGPGPGPNPGPTPIETVNPGPEVDGGNGPRDNGGPGGGPTPGTTNPPPVTPGPTPGTTNPPPASPGNGNGNGSDKDKDKDKGNGNGNAGGNGNGVGNGGPPPGQDKGNNGNGNGGGNPDPGPPEDKGNGNGGGNPDPGPPEDKGNGNGGGNPDPGPPEDKGNSGNGGGSTTPDPGPPEDKGNGGGSTGGSAGVGAGAGAAAPGNSGSAPGQDKGTDAPGPAADPGSSAPGNSNAGGNDKDK